MALIRKILIANRGEIACRILRTIEKMGLKSVTVCSDADNNSLHTKFSDEVFQFKSNNFNESYLSSTKIIEVALKCNCDAIHPGYGFLSENADFAQLCEQNDIIFIGPPVNAIRNMGIKNVAKSIMEAANVPIIKGYHGQDQTDDRLKDAAENIGYPIIIKPNLGGGGKGMKIVWNSSQFLDLLESSKREAEKYFGDKNVMIEKFIRNPRHIEVQIFGDKFGNYVHLFERDCSIQRRHQKILEESPAPNLSDEIRHELTETALKAARAVNYVGAGTVEFIFDNDNGQFYFMEMNTRLQVEHPVTEMITGIDLVEWQILSASGQKLPLNQDQIKLKTGHAIEARIYAEDCDHNFMPTCGTILSMTKPQENSIVRVDTGVREGDEIGVLYDPMIAKLIVRGRNRKDAIQSLIHNLQKFHIAGLKTNISFLINLIKTEQFKDISCIHTNFIQEYHDKLHSNQLKIKENLVFRAVLSLALYDTFLLNERARQRNDPYNPFVLNAGFRVNHHLIRKFVLVCNEQKFRLRIKFRREQDTYEMCFSESDNWILVKGKLIANKKHGKFQLESEIDNLTTRNEVYITEDSVSIFAEDGLFEFLNEDEELQEIKSIKTEVVHKKAESCVKSPLPGIVEKVYVKNGDRVSAGESLVLIISMKMEYNIKATDRSTISQVCVREGDNIKKDCTLIEFETNQ